MFATDTQWPSRVLSVPGASWPCTTRAGQAESLSSFTAWVDTPWSGGRSYRDWRTVRPVGFDQRGHGASTTRPGDLGRGAFVNDAVAVIESLGVGPVVLVGQSFGAHTALLVAASRPDLVSLLVLVEGGRGRRRRRGVA